MQHKARGDGGSEDNISDAGSVKSSLKRSLTRRNTTIMKTLKVKKTADPGIFDSELGSALLKDGTSPFVELEDPVEVAKRRAQDEEDQFKLNQYLKFKN